MPLISLSDYLKKYGVEGKGIAPKPAAYKCVYCRDAGFVSGDYPLDHPLYGKLMPCPKCATRNGGFVDEYGLLPADRGLTWDDTIDLNQAVTSAKSAVVKMLERGWGWVYLYGGYGTAKTQILKTAIAEANRAGTHAVYSRMADLFDEIRLAYDAKDPQGALVKRLNWYGSVGVLALDEIEKVAETPFVTERRFQILDRRYEAAVSQKYGVTIIAGNVPPSELDGALASRVNDARFSVVNVDTVDFRRLADKF
jgi:hypothetical protein